jgi:hypothetical protein
MGKEFVLILLDEIMNRSLSQKLDHLNANLGRERIYSDNIVEKVQEDLYMIVRMPYMKSSNRWYFIITISTYLINLIIVLLLRIFYPSTDSSSNPVQYIVTTFAAMIQPLIVYSLSGWLYYKACTVFEIK